MKEQADIDEVEFEESDHEIGVKTEASEEALAKVDIIAGDPFPEDPVLRGKETLQCTIRSITVGAIIGVMFAAANLYLCWKTGFSLDAGSVAIFMGYGILKLCQRNLPLSCGGGFFGPKENVTCQSAANGGSSAMGLFAAAYHSFLPPKLTSQGPSHVYAQTHVKSVR